MNKSDYYWTYTANGETIHQPSYIDGTKLKETGVNAKKLGVTGNGISNSDPIYIANGRYYVWSWDKRNYLDVTDEYIKYAKKNTNFYSPNKMF